MKTPLVLALSLVLGLSATPPASGQPLLEEANPPDDTYCVQATTIGGITTPRVCLPI